MSEYPDDFSLSDYDHEEYLAHEEAEYFDDWGEEPDIPFGYGYEDYDYDDPERFDPATHLVDIIYHGIAITNDGRVLSLQTRIYADEHTEDHQIYLEDTCDEPPDTSDIPF